MTRRYNVVLEWNEPDEDNPAGGYTVLVPSLPPVVTGGDTREEALLNAREAILCYLEYLLITGQPIPESDKSGENLVEVTV
ncbi:MAG: type II toxin-antitoxin system HicB family antitoxin [Peptococcaceae bacterium]|nr:type II toxin-antitoxin system HicB family antitoxin [Peptococcaceae bacterium]